MNSTPTLYRFMGFFAVFGAHRAGKVGMDMKGESSRVIGHWRYSYGNVGEVVAHMSMLC